MNEFLGLDIETVERDVQETDEESPKLVPTTAPVPVATVPVPTTASEGAGPPPKAVKAISALKPAIEAGGSRISSKARAKAKAAASAKPAKPNKKK